jgi:1,2-diacylglycerol 3-alpha-glucosyltransferase
VRIGIVTTWFERGGGYVGKQYANVLRQTHEVKIYARGGEYFGEKGTTWDKEYVTWGIEPIWGIPMPIDLGHMKKWIVENKLEIIFFNEQKDLIPVLECNKMGITTGAYVDYYTPETVPLFSAYDFLICNTKRHFQVFSWHPQCFYVPWGTETELFTPMKNESHDARLLTFFHSAGMSPYRKGTDLLIEAYDKVRGESRLVIHSQVDLSRTLPDSRDLIQSLKEDGKLTLIHKTVEAPGLYHLGDVYVYPTRLEGIGLTIAEALSCGLPVITTDSPPMNEFISEDSGRLVKVGEERIREDSYYWPESIVDISNLTDNMQYYIDRMDEIEKFKAAARRQALENLDWVKNSASLPNLFDKMKRMESLRSKALEDQIYARETQSFLRRLHYHSPKAYRTIFRLYGFLKQLKQKQFGFSK